MEPLDSPKAVRTALEDVKLLEQSRHSSGDRGNELQLLANGGYNDVWLVSRTLQDARQYVLRKPKEDALLPDQIRNEVAFLTFAKQNLPNVPVPKVYRHSLEQHDSRTHFIAEEFVDGQLLSSVWDNYDESTKLAVSRQIAEIVVTFGETALNGIGGLTLDHKLGPTVEGMKLFKGRDKYHSSEFYNIGPYNSTKEYVLACYDKEIYYYSYASEEDIDQDFFEEVSKADFIKTLQATRQSIAEDDEAFLPEEPFVLNHGDFHGRNIMMKDGQIAAVIDWEFAGFYPLSELLGGVGVDVLEMQADEDVDENNKWSEVIVKLAGEVARSRGWDERSVALLLGDEIRDLALACKGTIQRPAPLDGMWISSIVTPLLALCFLLDLSACLPNTHLRAAHRIGTPLPPEGILQDHASLHAKRLAIRSQNLTEGRLVVKDLTFLIPSKQHLALLSTMYNDIHTTATNALNYALDVGPTTRIVFRYGAFTLTVGCLFKLCGVGYLFWWTITIIEHSLVAMAPVQFTIMWYAVKGFFVYAVGQVLLNGEM